MKITNEIKKNLKIIIRNWTSLSLLILGPLLLISIIGFAFSGTQLHDISLGIVSEDKNITQFLNFTQGDITFYDDIDDCTSQLTSLDTHLCLDFSKDFIKTDNKSFIPTGMITFYYNPSQKTITNLLIKGIQESLGLKAQEISITSAETIFSRIQKLVIFLGNSQEDTKDLIKESYNIRKDLVQRRDILKNISSEFDPRYFKIKSIYSDIIDDTSLQDNRQKLYLEIDNIIALLDNTTLDNYKNISNYHNISNYNTTNLSNSTDVLSTSLDTFRSSLLALKGSTDKAYLSINNTFSLLNNLIYQLDLIKFSLDKEINITQDNIKKLDQAILRIADIRKNIDDNIGQLSQISPDISQDLINPITVSFTPLLDLSNIYLLFPTILTTIIIFISMLFSNIITLSEINSKAYFRSFIVPSKRSNFVIGLMITSIIILTFQITILVLVGQYMFNIDLFSFIADIYLIILVLITLFTIIGMTIAYFFRSQQTSILITTFTTLIIFLMSSSIVPIELMPKLAFRLARFNPFVIGQSAFTKAILFKSYTYVYDLRYLIIYILFFLFMLYYAVYRQRK